MCVVILLRHLLNGIKKVVSNLAHCFRHDILYLDKRKLSFEKFVKQCHVVAVGLIVEELIIHVLELLYNVCFHIVMTSVEWNQKGRFLLSSLFLTWPLLAST